jgi:phosphoenolpyruvate carboxykinase (ATP)
VTSGMIPQDFTLGDKNHIHVNPSREELIDLIRVRNEGFITNTSAVVVNTGEFTGRTPKDKYIVRSPATANRVWWGTVNQPISGEQFNRILHDQLVYTNGKELFIQYLSVGSENSLSLPLRVITESAWHCLFSLNLFKPIRIHQTNHYQPHLTILHTPNLKIEPSSAGINSGVFIALDLEKMIILIGGTAYAGEIKKAVFSVMNFVFPDRGMLTMHCSANIGLNGDTALFFGLSGTGKTTLSSSSDRKLIGDDEHGWTEGGIYNLEGGCYAKAIHLEESREPIIWKAVQSAGSVLENVLYDPGKDSLDFDSVSITENTRAAYPLSAVSPLDLESNHPHPKTIFFLTADAFGVLPPISRLDADQAVYHFLSGYTAKIAATELGLGKEPCATFSTCFAEPFLPLPPKIYANLFRERIIQFKPTIWLVNTGWVAGPYGSGYRIQLDITRALISAAMQGIIPLEHGFFDEFFGLWIPSSVTGIPTKILNPRSLWGNPSSYDQAALGLKSKFEKNYQRLQKSTS